MMNHRPSAVGCLSEETSRKIRNLGFLCSLFVVAIHTSWTTSGCGFFFQRLVFWSIGPVAVPFFFAVSGFFLAGHFQECGWWKRAIRTRLVSLLIPYLIWAVLFFMFQAFWDAFHSLSRGESFLTSLLKGLDLPRCLLALGVDFTRRPQLGVLWYIRCLMLFVMISPVILWVVLRIRYVGLAMAFYGMLHTTSAGFHIPGQDPCGFFIYGISLEGLWYFSLGILLRTKPINVSISVQWFALFFAGFFLSVHSLDLVKYWPVNPIVLSTPFVLLGLWICTPSTAWPSTLVSCAFPIYLLHTFFNYIVAWTSVRLGNFVSTIPGLSFLLASTCSICAALAIRRFTPKIGKVLFGGR